MNKHTPLISVVMTSYNHEKYLSQAIESVLNQTFIDFELIIIDDFSKDKSMEIIEAYRKKDKRIRPIYHHHNMGIAKTTNDGFDDAKGEFVAYMQSDDIWMQEKLEKQIVILEKDPNLIVWSDVTVIDSNGNENEQLFAKIHKKVLNNKNGFIFQELIRGSVVYVQSAIFKTQIARQFKFDKRLTYMNDTKFIIEVARNYPFFCISEPLVKYRVHRDNSILKNKDIWLKDLFIFNKYLLKKYGDEIPNDIRAKFYRRLAKYTFNKGHQQIGRKCFLRSIKEYPLKTISLKYYIQSLYQQNL